MLIAAYAIKAIVAIIVYWNVIWWMTLYTYRPTTQITPNTQRNYKRTFPDLARAYIIMSNRLILVTNSMANSF